MIRIADANDSKQITRLCIQLGYETTVEEVKNRLRRAFNDDYCEVYVAEIDGKISGWLQVALKETIESGEYVEITGLVVDKDARGKGIGRSLVKQAEEWAKKAGQRKIRVRTNVIRKEAPHFYRALGFQEIKKQSVFSKSI
jgi:N-acetylglutamate synthase-like GNAT family acetyltransferase